jgi:nifR3 family TIM-barrel protein
MTTSFWHTLPKPFTALAPLDGVTDVVFRQIITELGKPSVLFTEFTAVDGFVSSGKERVMQNFRYTPEQQSIVAQIWGTIPEHFYQTAKEVATMGFAGIDINMGCPDRTVMKGGAGGALINNPHLAKEIIKATKEGAGEVPVSVKTRIGFASEAIDSWIPFLLEQNITALTVHLRTVRELSQVPAQWNTMTKIKALRDTIAPETVLIGNGDITTREEIAIKYHDYGCEGFMVGRGIFSNPWIFQQSKTQGEKSIAERIAVYKRHISLYQQTWGDERNFANLKKFAKTYINSFPDASSLRETLMTAKNINTLLQILNDYEN